MLSLYRVAVDEQTELAAGMLRVCRQELLDTLEPRYELPAELFAGQLIDTRQLAMLRNIRDVYGKAAFVLRALRTKTGTTLLTDFLAVLDRTDQLHVAYDLIGSRVVQGQSSGTLSGVVALWLFAVNFTVYAYMYI